jgi:hypothetical protein
MFPRADTSIAMRLAPVELRAIERTFRDVGVLDLPEPHPAYPPDGGCCLSPSTTWHLDVLMSGKERHFDWDTQFNPGRGTPEWAALWTAVDSITAIVERRPEYRHLPPGGGGYM